MVKCLRGQHRDGHAGRHVAAPERKGEIPAGRRHHALQGGGACHGNHQETQALDHAGCQQQAVAGRHRAQGRAQRCGQQAQQQHAPRTETRDHAAGGNTTHYAQKGKHRRQRADRRQVQAHVLAQQGRGDDHLAHLQRRHYARAHNSQHPGPTGFTLIHCCLDTHAMVASMPAGSDLEK
ncbi:hypothetical protein D3C87_1419620 [compost metagenome]